MGSKMCVASRFMGLQRNRCGFHGERERGVEGREIEVN